MTLLPALLTLMLASSQLQSPITPDELQGEAWLIKHGIYTSQWKDPACRALALSQADETKMTTERLASARSLAENAGTVQGCDPDSEPSSEAIPATTIGMHSCAGLCGGNPIAVGGEIGISMHRNDVAIEPKTSIGEHSCGMCGDEETFAIGGGPSFGAIGPSPEQIEMAQQFLDIRLLRLDYEEAHWLDEGCKAAAQELINIHDGELASQERLDAAAALVDRASLVRNCRVAGDHLEADVGAFSDAANACKSTLYLYPTKSPFVKRLCPIGGFR